MLSSRLSVALGIAVVALEGRAEDAAFFESRIRPVLVEQCYECHSVESGKAKGGLQVDNRASLRRGGESGPAVVPGKPAESLLLSAMLHADPDLAMPPKKPRLAEGVLADFRRWIERGAVDPREESAISGSDAGGDGVRWSYRALPERVAAGASVESLWLAGLERQGLSPGPEADARTLLRRVYLDLTGLPPSPEEVAAFKLDQLPQVVDRLLASPEFGVRWGRHWLDVVRFAESNGRESNIIYPHAWRYRDYVIEAFQRDLPYDQFLREQIAGDLLPSASAEERARRLIATGFLALGAKGLNEQNKAQFAADLADEQLDTLSRAVLATSIACARCHDH
ncbi:MAG: DUF1549 domain-containing protein, partial [Verrucomicrobiales bacterium]|nr:DUF1549 domain-containing protein [Verrucomicrobiales bacterium]